MQTLPRYAPWRTSQRPGKCGLLEWLLGQRLQLRGDGDDDRGCFEMLRGVLSLTIICYEMLLSVSGCLGSWRHQYAANVCEAPGWPAGGQSAVRCGRGPSGSPSRRTRSGRPPPSGYRPQPPPPALDAATRIKVQPCSSCASCHLVIKIRLSSCLALCNERWSHAVAVEVRDAQATQILLSFSTNVQTLKKKHKNRTIFQLNTQASPSVHLLLMMIDVLLFFSQGA